MNSSISQIFHFLAENHGLSFLPSPPQAVLALAASWTSRQVGERTLTGTVVDSGDGVTHVIPVVSGWGEEGGRHTHCACIVQCTMYYTGTCTCIMYMHVPALQALELRFLIHIVL